MASRSNDRVPARLEVMFRSPSALLVAYSVNLSRGGMFIRCEETLPPVGAELDLSITLPNQEIVKLCSVVTWQRPENGLNGPRGVGVQFDAFPMEFGKTVDNLVLSYSGITIVIQCADSHDRKTLVRMLKAIIGTAEVAFVDDESVAGSVLEADADLLIVDVDEGEPGALVTLLEARKHHVPSIALSQSERESLMDHADAVLTNPPSSSALRKTVLQLLANPSRITVI